MYKKKSLLLYVFSLTVQVRLYVRARVCMCVCMCFQACIRKGVIRKGRRVQWVTDMKKKDRTFGGESIETTGGKGEDRTRQRSVYGREELVAKMLDSPRRRNT